MGRALLLSIPTAGHSMQLFPLVRELVRRGEKLTVYTSAAYRHSFEKCGAAVRLYPYVPDFRSDLRRHELNLRGLLKFVRRGLEWHLSLEDEPDFMRGDFDYLLADTLFSFGRSLAHRRGLKIIAIETLFALQAGLPVYQIPMLRWQEIYQLVPGFFDATAVARALWRLRRDHDFVVSPRDPVYNAERTLVFTSRELQPCAGDFSENFIFVGPLVDIERDEEPLDFAADAHRPLVLVSMGTIFNQHPDFYRICLKVFAELKVSAVMAVGEETDIASLGPVPHNVLIRHRLPQLSILKKASLFISHAGINSLSESLYFGVPLLLIPQQFEQLNNALRVQELGAGRLITKNDISAPRLRSEIEAMLTASHYRERAKAIAKSFAQSGGSRRAVDEILAYTQHVSLPLSQIEKS